MMGSFPFRHASTRKDGGGNGYKLPHLHKRKNEHQNGSLPVCLHAHNFLEDLDLNVNDGDGDENEGGGDEIGEGMAI